MPNEEIRIDISPAGDVTIEGVNIVGADCKALTKEIEAELGDVTKTTLKPDYHRARTAQNKVTR